MTPIQYGLIALLVALVAAVIYCLIRAARWKREHGEPDDRIFDPELTRFGNPFSPVRKEAERVLREGVAADRRDVAYSARHMARKTLEHQINPWQQRAFILMLLVQLPNIAVQTQRMIEDIPAVPLVFGAMILLGALVIAGAVLVQRTARRRVQRALELNEDLAAAFEAEHGRADGDREVRADSDREGSR